MPTLIVHFNLRTGSPKISVKTGESGAKRAQVFCARCGSPLYAHPVDNPKTYGLRVGCIAQRRELVPTLQIWCGSVLSFYSVDDAAVVIEVIKVGHRREVYRTP